MTKLCNLHELARFIPQQKPETKKGENIHNTTISK